LNIPGTDTTPAAPTGLRATITGSEVLLECDATPRATRYRFRTKIVGVDDSYKLAASSLTPMAMLEGVAAGITLEIIAQAVNGASQSVASDPITDDAAGGGGEAGSGGVGFAGVGEQGQRKQRCQQWQWRGVDCLAQLTAPLS
jgi:hypothetical protein